MPKLRHKNKYNNNNNNNKGNNYDKLRNTRKKMER